MTTNKPKKGKTITFYSYKGGVGRTMALVNTACLMAKQKKKVLLIDWDLEAPGLHTFFEKEANNTQLGLVDLISEIIKYTQTEECNTEEAHYTFLDENVSNYIQKNIQVTPDTQIDLLRAGMFDSSYSDRLNDINWIELYKNSPAFFRTFAKHLESQYDYILIDSRTGLSDTGGICTMLMPQILVLVFALNKQNINGVLNVAKQSLTYRFDSNDDRNLNILPLPARIDNQNSEELTKWIGVYSRSFEDFFKEFYMLDECSLENYFNIAKIPYKPTHAYGENIPVLTESIHNDLFISYHYEQFHKIIRENNPAWEMLSPEQIEKNVKLITNYIQTALRHQGEGEYNLANIEFEKAYELDTTNVSTLMMWSVFLGIKAQKMKNKDAEKNLLQAIEMQEKLLEMTPNLPEVYSVLGNLFSHLATTKKNKERESLLLRAIEFYRQATSIKPDSSRAFNDLGMTFLLLSADKSPAEAKILREEARKNITKSCELSKGHYNLARFHALVDEKTQALDFLDTSLRFGEMTTKKVLLDHCWKNLENDKDFMSIINKHRNFTTTQ